MTTMALPEVSREVDPRLVRQMYRLFKTAIRTYHRAEAQGVENIPDGGALLVGNHSGGILAMDVPVISVAFWDRFGVDRPFHVLAHDILMNGPSGALFRKLGFVSASRENARRALAAGGVTVVFPGGDYDVNRPIHKANVIDFNGRTGYVRSAVEAGVPIVPVVSIGGQEATIILARSTRLAKVMPWTKLFRAHELPVTVGLPWLVTFGFPPPFPLPSKIVTRFLEPIDVVAEFGPDADPAEVDAVVRERMQAALDELAAARRFPVIG